MAGCRKDFGRQRLTGRREPLVTLKAVRGQRGRSLSIGGLRQLADKRLGNGRRGCGPIDDIAVCQILAI